MCMEIIGGRKWEQEGIDRNIISKVILDLANQLAGDLDDICKNGNKECGLRTDEMSVRIGGSIRIMELAPSEFLAGDIDLDLYDSNPDNQPTFKDITMPVKEPLINKCNGEFKRTKQYSADFGEYSYHAEKSAQNWTEQDRIKRIRIPVKIILGTGEKNVEIDAELKNVTSRIWHVGYKAGKHREVSAPRGLSVPDNQLYMDICMRLCEMVVKSKEVTEDNLESEVRQAVGNKALLIKKAAMEGVISKEAVLEMAEDKLETEWNDLFKKAVNCDSCENLLHIIHEYLQADSND